MIHSKLLDKKNHKNNQICSENLYKGACVKIKNSNKTFQVIGLNIGKKFVGLENGLLLVILKKHLLWK